MTTHQRPETVNAHVDTNPITVESLAVEVTATLLIGDLESERGNCQMPTPIRGVHRHTDIPGMNPEPGHGARFVNTASYLWRATPDHLSTERPDLPIRGEDTDV
ncbi:hypothetical protein ACFXJO_16335 [Streptomyces lavendulae]|uniref:hypothetical protein n=1 Tax=Streptomyces lavendulae TaxID=1914 RepID=UPI0036C8FA98